MRIEVINTLTGTTGAVELPPNLNPVRIGHHPRNDLVLDSPHVGAEAAAIDNDVADGAGWRLWNRNGKEIRVGDVVLAARNRYARLLSPRVAVDIWPYVLTVCFSPEEVATQGDDFERLDRACADLVRQVHAGLVALHPHDPPDRTEWLRDGYVHTLEREVVELAGGRPDFPSDDLTATELATHMAGVAVRSALVQRLARRAKNGRRTAAPPEAGWARFRTAIPDLEAELGRLAEEADAALALRTYPDLTEQVGAVDAGFWSFWRERAAGGRIPPRVGRYLALRRLTEEVKDVWYGFGPLEDLLDDPGVTEIMVIDADRIFIEKWGRTERSGRRFLTDPVPIFQRIAARANRQVNAAQPLADLRMPDGSRVNVVIPPVALSGPCLTVRRFPIERLTDEDLVGRCGSLTRAARDFLRAAVRGRHNLIVSGGTGTGKTTMLNILSGFIPDRERIVTIEDTAELRLPKDHVITLQARPKNGEGAGEVSIRDLVRNALRMRPDRIVVGECRAGEALDMLQAMNTGHDGSMTTLHANDPVGAIDRLVVLVQQAAASNLPVESIHQQIASALDLIVQLGEVVRWGRRQRVVVEIAEVTGYDPEDRAVRLTPLFRRTGDGPLAPTGYLPSFLPDLIAGGHLSDPLAVVGGCDAPEHPRKEGSPCLT